MSEIYVTIFQKYDDDGRLRFYNWSSFGEDELRERLQQIGSSAYCRTVDLSSDTAAQTGDKQRKVSEVVREAN